jgi:hypothetical protein
MARREIDISQLEPGKRYYYTTESNSIANRNPNYILEGTFDKVVQFPGSPHQTYFFNDVATYVHNPRTNKMTKKIISRASSYTGDYFHPQNIHVYEFPNLPEDINRVIQTFGGKPRKSKKNRKSIRRNKTNRKKH